MSYDYMVGGDSLLSSMRDAAGILYKVSKTLPCFDLPADVSLLLSMFLLLFWLLVLVLLLLFVVVVVEPKHSHFFNLDRFRTWICRCLSMSVFLSVFLRLHNFRNQPTKIEQPNFDGIWNYQWCTELLPQETYFSLNGTTDMFWAR